MLVGDNRRPGLGEIALAKKIMEPAAYRKRRLD
jgi:hypothetical protein